MAFKDLAEAEAAYAELSVQARTDARDNQTNRKGYNGLKKFLESKGLDVEGDLEAQWNEQGPGKSKAEKDALEAKIDNLTKKYEKAEKDREAAQHEITNGKIKNDLVGKMSDVIGHQELIDLWLATGRIKVDDKGKAHFDSDGDEISIDKALENFRKANPDRIKIKQKDGAGTHANTNSGAEGSEGSGEKKAKMSYDDFYKLDRKAKDKYILEGGKVELAPLPPRE
jgi:hypothetical protein